MCFLPKQTSSKNGECSIDIDKSLNVLRNRWILGFGLLKFPVSPKTRPSCRHFPVHRRSDPRNRNVRIQSIIANYIIYKAGALTPCFSLPIPFGDETCLNSQSAKLVWVGNQDSFSNLQENYHPNKDNTSFWRGCEHKRIIGFWPLAQT